MENVNTKGFVDKTRKYARQLVEISKSKSKLIVRDQLFPLTEKDNVPFLEVFAHYSVYKMDILNYEEKRSDTANIPLDDLPSIIAHTALATKYIFRIVNGLDKQKTAAETPAEPTDGGTNVQMATGNTPAFTVTMTMGSNEMKGKSPAQYFMEAANKKQAYEALKKQWTFLKSNAQKYPNNRTVMQAIQEAAQLAKDGKLPDCSQTAGAQQPADELELKIYIPPVKYFTTEKNGMKKCYDLKIFCYPYKTYPYKVMITNFYAPVRTDDKGMTQIMMNQKEKGTETRSVFNLSEIEWLHVLEEMKENKANMRAALYAHMRGEDENRQEYKRES